MLRAASSWSRERPRFFPSPTKTSLSPPLGTNYPSEVMRQGVLLVVFAVAAAGFAVGSVGAPNRGISQRAIGGASLGLTRAGYVHRFGKPSFTTRFGGGMTRLVYADREVAIYLSRKGRGIAVLTSAKEYRTPAGVGPCSTIAALKKAYPGRLTVTRRAGHVVAYRLRRLLFAAPGGKVGAVMLANSAFPSSVAVNAGQCGGGEED
jgi:hypothetical protein